MEASAISRTEALNEAEQILSKATCLDCPTYKTCKEICPAVEAVLPKPRSGGHRKEFPTDKIEEVYAKHKERETGIRVKPKIYGDSLEGF